MQFTSIGWSELVRVLMKYGIQEGRLSGFQASYFYVEVMNTYRHYPVFRRDPCPISVVDDIRQYFSLTPDHGVSDDDFYS